MTDDKLIDDLEDLYVQATRERSHYYVGSRTRSAAARIRELLVELARYKGFHDGVCKTGTHVIVPVSYVTELKDMVRRAYLEGYEAAPVENDDFDVMKFAERDWLESDTHRAMIRAAQEG